MSQLIYYAVFKFTLQTEKVLVEYVVLSMLEISYYSISCYV